MIQLISLFASLVVVFLFIMVMRIMMLTIPRARAAGGAEA